MPVHENNPVWQKTLPSGFVQRMYIMYHGTSAEAAEAILVQGFKPSTVGSLSPKCQLRALVGHLFYIVLPS